MCQLDEFELELLDELELELFDEFDDEFELELFDELELELFELFELELFDEFELELEFELLFDELPLRMRPMSSTLAGVHAAVPITAAAPSTAAFSRHELRRGNDMTDPPLGQ